MKRAMTLVLALVLVGCAPRVFASPFIIDTGNPTSGSSGCGICIDATTWNAVQFSLDRAYAISSIESVFQQSTVVFSVYADDGGLPFATNLPWGGTITPPVAPLFSGSATLDNSPCCPQWFGVTGLHETLDAGLYWVVFASPDGAVQTSGVPNPMAREARGSFAIEHSFGHVIEPYEFSWGTPTMDLALRIAGEPVQADAVPEPSSLLLLATGALLLARRGRRANA